MSKRYSQFHFTMAFRLLVSVKRNNRKTQGFVLPMVLLLGLVLITLMTATLIEAQSTRASSKTNQKSAGSVITADSAIARVLAELSKPENSGLLGRNYDPINPDTGRNYLGDDGLAKTGDETNIGIDQWTGYDPSRLPCFALQGLTPPTINLTGNIGANTSYTLLAYRYNPSTQIGRVLIEGTYQGQSSNLLVSISIRPDMDNFPGISVSKRSENAQGSLVLRGREVIGNKGNIYFVPRSSADPTISGSAASDDIGREQYLNAIWSSPLDGSTTDTVAGSIYACNPAITLPIDIQGKNQGVIDSSMTLRGVNGNEATYFQVDKIHLDNSEVLNIDTTGGPVIINITPPATRHKERVTLRDSAKISNIRTDGQPPRVGDARIIGNTQGAVIALYDEACIEQIFLYSRNDEVFFLTDKPGCSSGQNTNFEGVIWAEAILSSRNNATNRQFIYPLVSLDTYDRLVTPNATSGMAVPDDLSSLSDLLQYMDVPVQYRYDAVLSWQTL